MKLNEIDSVENNEKKLKTICKNSTNQVKDSFYKFFYNI